MGKSIQTEADLGYFDERKGNQYVIGDIYQSQEMTRKISGCAVFYAGAQYGVIPVETVSDDVCGKALRELSLWKPVVRNADALWEG